MNNNSNSFIIGIIVVILIVIVGWLAYSQGFFRAKEQTDSNGVQIKLGGSSSDSNKSY